MALGFFIIFLTICGAGVFAFLFFYFMVFAWKKGKKTAAAILAVLGAACVVFAVWYSAILVNGLSYFF